MRSWIVTLGLLGCPQPPDTTTDVPTGPTGLTDTTDVATDTSMTTGDTGGMTDTTDTGTLPPGALVDTCEAVAKETPLVSGRYEGDSSTVAADVDPGSGACVGRSGAPGSDVVGLVRVPPGDILTAELVHGHGAVYLLEDCADASTCVDGAAEGPVSTLRFVNRTKKPVDRFLVVDGTISGGEPWALDVDLSSSNAVTLYDNCAQAAYSVSEKPGTLQLDMSAATDGVNPSAGTCGLTSGQGGPDRLIPFDVLAGQVLEVDAPTVTYLLTDCTDPDGTCLTSNLGSTTSWFNDGALAERVFVAVEAPEDGRSDVFDVDLSMFRPNLVQTPDTCAQATLAKPLALGSQAVSLQGLGHEGLNAINCGPGAAEGVRSDAIFPVVVGAGQEAALEFDEPLVAYWVTDCDDTASCVGGGEQTTRLAYHNDTDASVTIYAVLEGEDPLPAITDMTLRNRVLTVPAWPDTCADVAEQAPVTKSGTIQVSLTDAADDFDASLSFCSGPFALDGGDRVVPLEVAPGDRVTARVARGDDAVTLTLLTDCVDPNACEETANAGQAIDYFNGGTAPVALSLVVDTRQTVGAGAVNLEIDFDTPDALGAADTCVDAGLQTDLPPGTYVDRVSDLTNQVELDGAGCLLVPTPGSDALVPVTVPAGQRLDVSVDGVLDQIYVVTDCTDIDTCEQGASVGDGPLSWPNDTATSQSATLVLDGLVPLLGGNADFTVDVDLVSSSPIGGGDTCTEAQVATALSPGSYHGSTVGAANDLEAASCLSGPARGPDVMVPVALSADTMAEVTAWGAGVQLYFVDDCADDLTCGDVAEATDVPGVVRTRWHNDSGVATTRYLVVDRSAFTTDFVVEYDERAVTPTTPDDTCAAAAGTTDLVTGTHLLSGTLTGLGNDLDPASGTQPSCTGTVAQGADGIIPIALSGGETVRATLSVTGADASMYLRPTCNSADTCVAGAYEPGAVTVVYTNEGVAPERQFLVLDTLIGDGSFLLEVVIE